MKRNFLTVLGLCIALLGASISAFAHHARLERMLRYVFDEREFLSPFGIRSMSARHRDQPAMLRTEFGEFQAAYVPGESESPLFGGNSNWRGPVWFPVNYLIVEALERYHHFYGDSFRVEVPVGSGQTMNLREAGCEISRRLVRLFVPNGDGHRACHDPGEQPPSMAPSLVRAPRGP